MHAIGTFEVKLNPLQDDPAADPMLGRMSIDKQFHGALEGTSKGQMLTGMTATKGSAGYVAMERFTGTLPDDQGKDQSGSFILQHTGTMTRGEPSLSVTVVPDSGTEQLTGLTGKMTIDIVDGEHHYEFTYKLNETN